MTVFVITGASRGLGKSLALKNAGKGVSLGLVDIASEGLEEVAELCRSKGATVLTNQIDVRNQEEIGGFIKRMICKFGEIDYVFANAGVASAFSENEYASFKIEVARDIMDTNYYGALNTFFPAIEHMLGVKRGHLIAISSISSLAATHNSGSYSASKAALSIWTDGLRLKLVHQNISVTNVILGFVDTPMIATFIHAQRLSISSELAAHQIMLAVYKKKKIVSIPKLRNIPWYILRFTPVTVRQKILDWTWERIYHRT